jgi:CheY-like chemotaxis protein
LDNFKINILKEHAKDIQILYLEPFEDITKSFSTSKLLSNFFKKVTIVTSADAALSLFYSGFYDIVITNMHITDMEVGEFCSKIKSKAKRKPIVVVSQKEDFATLSTLVNVGISGYINYPFKKYEIIDVMSNIIDDIVDLKMMYKHHDSYIEILEDMINPQTLNQSQNEKIDKSVMSNIRFNQAHKISAKDFIKQVDVSVLDKMDNFLEDLDRFAIIVYDIDELEYQDGYKKIVDLIDILDIFEHILENIILFPIISDTFKKLINFLNSLEPQDIKDQNKKTFLVESLLGLEKDLRIWINTIFIEKDTQDIHYFDASFANNALEIESIFYENKIVTDEDDLEFF